MKKFAVPDGWTDYDPFSSVIKNTRFLPIKVPLKDEICRRVDPEFRFTPEDFLELCEERSFKIGMIIDFTFTSRYYDYLFFEERGIKYKKIPTGGGMIPDDSITSQFHSAVKNFLSKEDDTESLIAVHCTHGVNRTGYIVCHYLITEMNVGIEEAIQDYADARGYPIERPNYLSGLRELNLPKDSSSRTEVDDESRIELRNKSRYHPYSHRNSYVPNTGRKAPSSYRNQNRSNEGFHNSYDSRRRPYDRPQSYSQSYRYRSPHRSSTDKDSDDWRSMNNLRPGWNERRNERRWRSKNDDFYF